MKPTELIGILVGLAGLGIGAYALLRRQPTAPPAAVAGPVAPIQPVQPAYGQPVYGTPGWYAAGGTSGAIGPGPGSAGAQNVGQIVGQVAQGVQQVATTIGSIVDFFGSL